MILDNQQILNMRACGQILKNALFDAVAKATPGTSCNRLDQIAENALLHQKATPSFKNYLVEGIGRYPFTILTSVNNEVVHGLPVKNKILKDGDIVSIDIGAIYKGVCTDMTVTVGVGNISPKAQNLIDKTRISLEKGIDSIKIGGHIGDIGHAVQTYAESFGYGVVRDLVGHGIGTKPHMTPQIPNFGRQGTGMKIRNGMGLAIEPMITAGDFHIKAGDDDWTVLTVDGSLAAHFEHTIVMIDDEAVVVTR
ncbi:MAG: type I methionyl aminopeptidase [bacterium]